MTGMTVTVPDFDYNNEINIMSCVLCMEVTVLSQNWPLPLIVVGCRQWGVAYMHVLVLCPACSCTREKGSGQMCIEPVLWRIAIIELQMGVNKEALRHY